MSNDEPQKASQQPIPGPLSWPPPGMEHLQGRLWRVIGISWAGSLILVLPLLWALEVEQPFYSLGPFEDNWRVGLGIASLGAVIILFGFGTFFGLMRAAAKAADAGYGTMTIVEIVTDVSRDNGFLIQGKPHFSLLDAKRRAAVVSARLRGSALVLAAALWFVVGFGIAIMLAARGFVTPSGIWPMAVGPSAFMFVAGQIILILQAGIVRGAKQSWNAKEGSDRVATESAAWTAALDEAGDVVVLGAGPKGEGGMFRTGGTVVVVLFIGAFVPTLTLAVTTSTSPILTQIAVPTFLSVQEMAGGTEVLRHHTAEADPTITPAAAGEALHNIAFVGGGNPEPWENPPAQAYPTGWFPDPDFFPDPFSESIASDLMMRPLADFSPEEQAAMRQAAEHPAHEEFHALARAELVDVVSGRWRLPFPDTLTFADLPWPRFQAYRTAGLAQVAKAAVEVSAGEPEEAEHTL
ncbi:MAG: hypothetical protein O2992_15540, partial [Gemmatimonadetes bacterium]|nr:hypothetical protein [Gemmatimonadota bacterium]